MSEDLKVEAGDKSSIRRKSEGRYYLCVLDSVCVEENCVEEFASRTIYYFKNGPPSETFHRENLYLVEHAASPFVPAPPSFERWIDQRAFYTAFRPAANSLLDGCDPQLLDDCAKFCRCGWITRAELEKIVSEQAQRQIAYPVLLERLRKHLQSLGVHRGFVESGIYLAMPTLNIFDSEVRREVEDLWMESLDSYQEELGSVEDGLKGLRNPQNSVALEMKTVKVEKAIVQKLNEIGITMPEYEELDKAFMGLGDGHWLLDEWIQYEQLVARTKGPRLRSRLERMLAEKGGIMPVENRTDFHPALWESIAPIDRTRHLDFARCWSLLPEDTEFEHMSIEDQFLRAMPILSILRDLMMSEHSGAAPEIHSRSELETTDDAQSDSPTDAKVQNASEGADPPEEILFTELVDPEKYGPSPLGSMEPAALPTERVDWSEVWEDFIAAFERRRRQGNASEFMHQYYRDHQEHFPNGGTLKKFLPAMRWRLTRHNKKHQ